MQTNIMISMLNIPRMQLEIAEKLHQAFADVLLSGQYINGPFVDKFEKELAAVVDIKACIGVSSGTDALLVSMMSLDVKPGDEIITTPYTFFATAGCISRLGAKPVFVDIEKNTYNIDSLKIEQAITTKTVGIIPVHLFGACANMTAILQIANSHKLWVLEDAAQAIGATHKGQPAGKMGQLGIYSFFPAKNLGALGDAGAVVTDDLFLENKIKILRGHGAQKKYHHSLVGGNFRLDALQAAMLSVKLPYLHKWEKNREALAQRYDSEFASFCNATGDMKSPTKKNEDKHVYNQYVIRVKKRNELIKEFSKNQIGCVIYYPEPLHLQPCFASLGYKQGDFIQSELAAKETLAIPIDPSLTYLEQSKIIEIVHKVLTG